MKAAAWLAGARHAGIGALVVERYAPAAPALAFVHEKLLRHDQAGAVPIRLDAVAGSERAAVTRPKHLGADP